MGIAVEGGQMVLRQTSPPGFCRAFRELSMNLVDYGIDIQVAQPGDSQMSIVYSLILSDGTADIRDRRRLRIERDDGVIKLGECVNESCDVDLYGSFPYDPAAHVWWRFGHDSATETVHFEFAADDEIFQRPEGVLPATGITSELVGCVGVELGSYELDTPGTAAFDFLTGSSNSF